MDATAAPPGAAQRNAMQWRSLCAAVTLLFLFLFLFFSSLCCAGLLIALCPHMPAQAAFFLGPTIPLPLPWVPAPFHAFMTQKGLEESWSAVSGPAAHRIGGRRARVRA